MFTVTHTFVVVWFEFDHITPGGCFANLTVTSAARLCELAVYFLFYLQIVQFELQGPAPFRVVTLVPLFGLKELEIVCRIAFKRMHNTFVTESSGIFFGYLIYISLIIVSTSTISFGTR